MNSKSQNGNSNGIGSATPTYKSKGHRLEYIV